MNPSRLLPCACALALTATATAQRPMSLSTAPVYGSSTTIVSNYPVTAAGSIYALLWSQPFPFALSPSIPGFTVNGLARVDLSNFIDTNLGIYDGSGTVSVPIAIPFDPTFVGLALDVQTIDLDAANLALEFADNDVEIVVGCGIGEVNIAVATSAAFLANDNDAGSIHNGTIGAPVSQGLAAYAYAFTRHRGDEGFVEGVQGTFSSTSHLSDIDSVGNRRVNRRLANAVYQVVACPNGYDLSIVRSTANPREFGMLSYERATGTARIVPGTTFVDSLAANTAFQGIQFYPAFSRDGQWCAVILKDNTTPTPPVTDRVLAFRTDGLSPAIDITPAGPTVWFDATGFFTDDFLLIAGNGGWYWTSATAPTTLLPVAMPNTAASNAPNIWIYPFSWRVSPDGATAWLPIGSLASASRGEMDIVRVTANAGAPLAVNCTQFPVPSGLAEFGYSAITPSTVTNSSTGIKASVSPDGTRLAVLAATTASTAVFPGLYVCDGTANPPLRTVAGAAYYSEVAFINDTTVIFFAGASSTTQGMYSLDVPSGAITQIGTALDHRTRGSFWSLNKDWWYFIRSNAASDRNDIVGVRCATGAVFDVTGTEFGGGGVVGRIRTGSFNTTADPWFALEMQVRRAPVGGYAYFTARRETGTAGLFEDANVFRWDIENGGTATMLTANTGTGAAAAIKNIESLTISRDGNHIAWAQRTNTIATASEDVFHLDLGTSAITQASVANPAGQTITDGSIRFTCDTGGTPTGLVWSLGTGSVTLPTANAVVQWAALGSGTPVTISAPAAGTRLYQIIGTNL